MQTEMVGDRRGGEGEKGGGDGRVYRRVKGGGEKEEKGKETLRRGEE